MRLPRRFISLLIKADQILIEFVDKKVWGKYLVDLDPRTVLGPLLALSLVITGFILAIYVFKDQMMGWFFSIFYGGTILYRAMFIFWDKDKKYVSRYKDRSFPEKYTQAILWGGVATAISLPIILRRIADFSATEFLLLNLLYDITIFVEIFYAYLRRVYYFEEWFTDNEEST